MTRKLYPIGIQTFERIRQENNVYIDKTEYVYHMTHADGRFFFLNRPRRFGKSLLVSTFKSYFEGRKDLFKGLAIEHLEKEWNEYISVWQAESILRKSSWKNTSCLS